MNSFPALHFRTAREADADAVLALYRSAVGRPFCAWDESYPGREEIQADIASGGLYLLEDGSEIVGAVSVVPENELDGLPCWRQTQNAREIARVVVRPSRQGQGLSETLVSLALDVLRRSGCPAVHLAVAGGNLPARRLYARLGFAVVGENDMYDCHFYLCEKPL